MHASPPKRAVAVTPYDDQLLTDNGRQVRVPVAVEVGHADRKGWKHQWWSYGPGERPVAPAQEQRGAFRRVSVGRQNIQRAVLINVRQDYVLRVVADIH